jgi:uncharacterized protein (PEP-CTERM system associated)
MVSAGCRATPPELRCPSALRALFCAPALRALSRAPATLRAGSLTLAAAALLASAVATGGDWKVRPQLTVSERFSDNLTLSQDPDSGFATRISPGVRLLREGGRVKADVNYILENFFYHGAERSSVTNNNLRANLTAELIDPWFYLDASAYVQQAASSLLGVFGVDQSTGGNFSDISSVSVSPRIRYRHANQWSGETSLTTTHLSSTGSVSDSLSNELRAGINSGTAFGKLGWSANYFAEKTEYSSAGAQVNSQELDAGVSYRIAPKIRLLGNLGYEEFDSDSLSENQSGVSWSVGALWQPTNRTSLQATAGRRFFGNAYGLNLSHRTRRTTWSLSYSEDVTSTRSQLDLATDVRNQLDIFLRAGGVTDPIERARQIDALVDRIADQSIIFTNQLFLQKRLQGSIIWELPKHTFVFSGFGSSRDVDTVGGRRSVLFGNSDFNISRVIKESGLSATWSWQIMPKTSAVSTLSTVQTQFTDIDRDDDQFLLSLGLLHQLSRHASGSLEFRHQKRDSTGGGQEFDENSLEAGLQLTY